MKQRVLLGGYTRHEGRGVYRATFDDDGGTLSTPKPYITNLGSPTYLAVSCKNIAYVIDEEGQQGGLAAIDLNDDTPTLISRVLENGSSPAHVSIDEKRQLVFASNYHMGKVDVYKIGADGALTKTDEVVHHGRGPRPEQEMSHVHFANLTPDQRLAVVDLGNDTLTTYDVSLAGKLSLASTLELPAGYGPRHLVFNGQRNVAYLLGELSSQLSVLQYDEDDGSFHIKQTVTTIPTDWNQHNGAAAIRISGDNRFLYVSNRGFNTIAVFEINNAGLAVKLVQQIDSEGDFPRDFNLDLTGKYVLLVNQNSSNGTLYKRDQQTGKLTVVQKGIVAPESVNVVFLK